MHDSNLPPNNGWTVLEKTMSTTSGGDRQIDNAPTDRPTDQPTDHHIDDKGKLLSTLRTETERKSYPIFLLLLNLSLLLFQHLPSSSNIRSSNCSWLSVLLLSIHFGKEGLWFRPVFLRYQHRGWLRVYCTFVGGERWRNKGMCKMEVRGL